MKCICDQFWTPCSQSSTQEDLLCNGCREHPAHGFTGDGLLSQMEMAT